MPKIIVIAASDPNITYLLQRYAEASGFQSILAAQGKELQGLVQRLQPDVVVLEVELPEADARQALALLKSDPSTRAIPIIVYSCYDEISYGPVEGAASCLQKSVMYSDFLAAIRQAGVRVGSPSDLDARLAAGSNDSCS